jgi:hypothetical protein
MADCLAGAADRRDPDEMFGETLEIGSILDACAGRPEREHLIRFMVVELDTAGRPDAVLGLTDANIDLKRNLIDPRQPSDKELEILAEHSAMGTTARNYVHLSPDYLRDAIEQIDAFFDELSKHTKAHLGYAGDTQLQLSFAA